MFEELLWAFAEVAARYRGIVVEGAIRSACRAAELAAFYVGAGGRGDVPCAGGMPGWPASADLSSGGLLGMRSFVVGRCFLWKLR